MLRKSESVSIEVHLDDLFIWFAAMREAPDEVPPAHFTERIGIDWGTCDALGQKIREYGTHAGHDGTVRLVVATAELDVIRRCLIATIEGLGFEEFHTRVGRLLTEGYVALRRLAALTNDANDGGADPTIAEYEMRRHAEAVRGSAGTGPRVARPSHLMEAEPDDLFVWFSALREPRYLVPGLTPNQVGLDWEGCDRLSDRLLTYRANAGYGEPIQLPISSAELSAVRRCLHWTVAQITAAEGSDRAAFTEDIEVVLHRLEKHRRSRSS